MAAFLTKNAPGLRTSPVKRGNWVVKNVLGERISPPPPGVPELPQDEAKLDLPLARDAGAPSRRSRSARPVTRSSTRSAWCSKATVRSASAATRTWRAGRSTCRPPSPAAAKAPAFEGLRSYIREHRQRDFVDNLSGKLLAYALGRSLLLSDEPLVEDMGRKLAASGYRFDSLIESIVTSRQFLNKRGVARHESRHG